MRAGRERGVTLVELIITTGILAVVLLVLIQQILGSRVLTRESAERTQAQEAAYAAVDEMRAALRSASMATDHDDNYLNVVSMDGTSRQVILLPNPNDPATGVEANLTIETFQSASGVDEASANTSLAAAGYATAGSIDVDGDGDPTETDVAIADLELLPVLITVTWRPDSWTPGQPDAQIQLGAILY